MKYLKYFESISAFDDDWDFDEEEFEEKSYKDIPVYQTVGISFDSKDRMRINGIFIKAKDFEHVLRLAQTMANRITHIDKAIKRGNACSAQYSWRMTPEEEKSLEDIFYNRAKKLYFG